MSTVNRLLKFAAPIVILGLMSSHAKADDVCGRAPVFDTSKAEANGSLALQFLRGLVGNADVRGGVTVTPEDVIHLYPDAGKLLPRITVFIMECKLVVGDDLLNPSAKRMEILSIFNLIFLSQTSLRDALRPTVCRLCQNTERYLTKWG